MPKAKLKFTGIATIIDLDAPGGTGERHPGNIVAEKRGPNGEPVFAVELSPVPLKVSDFFSTRRRDRKKVTFLISAEELDQAALMGLVEPEGE